VWVSEPAPGRIHDITLYRMHLQPLILPWETLLGDKGFQGEPELITPVKGRTLTPFEKASNTYIGSVRAIIERTIGRIKRFAAVSHVWRHDRALHPVVFKVCANLAQLTMEVAPLVKEDYGGTFWICIQLVLRPYRKSIFSAESLWQIPSSNNFLPKPTNFWDLFNSSNQWRHVFKIFFWHENDNSKLNPTRRKMTHR
jgi:hypothetical protein